MTARWILAVVAMGTLLTGCRTSIPGTPVTSAKSPTEPNFPTSRPTAAPPTAVTPAPTSSPAAPGAEVLRPENGYVFIETKSGKTRCQLSTAEVGCEAQFTNSPVLNGTPGNGVRLPPMVESVGWSAIWATSLPSLLTTGGNRRSAGPSTPARTAPGSRTTAPATA
jgi:hypothetical protein